VEPLGHDADGPRRGPGRRDRHERRGRRALCALTGLEDVAGLALEERERRYEDLRARLAGVLAARTRDEWADLLTAAGVPFAPVNSLDEVARDAHVAARRLLVEVAADGTHPDRLHVRQPFVVDGVAGGPTRHVPALGEHTRAVLGEVAYDEVAIDALVARGIAGPAGDAAPDR
jgi:crotonobetainyl-CoA:carnitine CoA-transferase CaiB-like acyl-CoA transferase